MTEEFHQTYTTDAL